MRALLPLLLLAGCIPEPGPIDSRRPPDDSGRDTEAPGCTWYADADGDGFGDPLATVEASCEGGPSGYVGDATDCDDTDPAVHPGATEICNDGVDDDCDAATDEDADGDGDGIGPCGGDCDDTDAGVFPGADEVCDGLDNDCDPGTDEDGDGDLDGWSICDGDCDDDDELRSPQAVELDDGEDDDCDGVVDDDAVHCNVDVPENYTTIAGAMDAAPSGGVVCVAPGEYRERLSFSEKEVHIVGVAGPVLTVLDGDGEGPVVQIAVEGRVRPELVGLRIRNGHASGDGGGVRVSAGNAALRDVVIEDCSSDVRGGGLAVQAGAVDVSDSTLRGNSANYAGGGIYVTGTATLTIRGVSVTGNDVVCAYGCSGGGLRADGATLVEVVSSSFTGNTASRGAGLDVSDTDGLTLRSVSLRDNAATGYGGGLYAWQSTIAADQLWISGNSSTDWGGGIYGTDSAFILNNVVVAGNSAAWGAAGMELFGGSLQLTHGLFARNRTEGTGGGLVLIDWADATLESTIFLENEASEGGGALHLFDEHEDLTLNACDLWGDLPTETEGLGTLSSAEDLGVAPDLLDLSGDDPWAWDVHLAVGSALRDAGPEGDADPDAGPADLGPFGGPGAGDWDLDGDGFPAWWHPGPYDPEDDPFGGWDCDDHDPLVYPGAGCG
ncbi:MAG: MopE-related protein [Pseudomonadota bacterium]